MSAPPNAYANLIPTKGIAPTHLLKPLKEHEWRVIYFDAPNRGEQVRLLLHLVGQPFEDYRMAFPHGKTPLMSISDAGDQAPMAFDLCPIVQHGEISIGIVPGCMLYIAEHFNLVPSNINGRSLCAGLVDASEMMRDDVFYGKPIGYFNRAKARKMPGTFSHEVYHKWLGHFERFLRNKEAGNEPLLKGYDLNGPFFFGKNIYYPDISIYDTLMGIWAMDLYDLDLTKRRKRYPLLHKFVSAVSNLPGIKEYENKRGTRLDIYRKAEEAGNKRFEEKKKKENNNNNSASKL